MNFPANAQSMASVSKRLGFGGDERLGTPCDGDTWLTPRYILDSLGEFDLDPCAADANPSWVAPRFFLKADNGLLQDWAGRAFMNPPFSNTAAWLSMHSHHGLGISLVPASVESRV